METITVVDPGWDWAYMAWFFIPALSAFLASGVLYAVAPANFSRRKVDAVRAVGAGFLGAAIGAAVLGLLIGGAFTSIHWGSVFENRLKVSLEDSGYSVASVTALESGDSYLFIGQEDGEPMSGVVYHDGGDTYQVVSGGKK